MEKISAPRRAKATVSHRLKQLPFHLLQCEDGQVGRDNDAYGIENWPLHFVGRFPNAHHGGPRIGPAQVPHNVFHHHHGAIHHHAEIERAQG